MDYTTDAAPNLEDDAEEVIPAALPIQNPATGHGSLVEDVEEVDFEGIMQQENAALLAEDDEDPPEADDLEDQDEEEDKNNDDDSQDVTNHALELDQLVDQPEFEQEIEFIELDEDEEHVEDEDASGPKTKYGRTVKPVDRLTYNYATWQAGVIAKIIDSVLGKDSPVPEQAEECFATTYTFKQAINKFGDKGKESALKEMRQLHERKSAERVLLKDLTNQERIRALKMVDFVLRKKCGTLKSRACIDGRPQKNYVSKEDISSPTPVPDSVFLTGVIEAKEGRYVYCMDIPNAFVQADYPPPDPGEPRTVIILTGVLVDLLLEIARATYEPFVTFDQRGRRVLYMIVTRAIYGMIESPMLWYQKLTKDLKEYGFVVNPYDACVANKVVEGLLLTIVWHIDDIKVSHRKKEVLEDFVEWLDSKYSNKKGKVTVSRGPRHLYLGMYLDYAKPGCLIVDMSDYVAKMLGDFEATFLNGATLTVVRCPWTEQMYEVDTGSKRLSSDRKENFHTFVARGLYLCTHGRPDIIPIVMFLCTRVQSPTEQDYGKLLRMMRFLKATVKDVLTLTADQVQLVLYSYWDAAFGVQPDMKSQTGGALTLGKGVLSGVSRKQKLNTRSSTEAELVAADEGVGPTLWAKWFLEAQGCPVDNTIFYQDNKSAMLLEKNGKASSTKRTRHLQIRYFYIKDQIDKGYFKLEYCPTDDMLADFFTKAITGAKFEKTRTVRVMNMEYKPTDVSFDPAS